ncbi:DUF1661 domain-containing protein [Porphyromonas gulae]|uniref:DUF1661 domain-containing protein n=1 Tax=Porphyromonas gulae TaxID=111105 RepID=UPI001F23B098|nr:DUF1661 domain-containing protein [Porphyromonas gulae]
MARKFFTSRAKSKKFSRHVFSDHKRKNFGTQTDRARDIVYPILRCAFSISEIIAFVSISLPSIDSCQETFPKQQSWARSPSGPTFCRPSALKLSFPVDYSRANRPLSQIISTFEGNKKNHKLFR